MYGLAYIIDPPSSLHVLTRLNFDNGAGLIILETSTSKFPVPSSQLVARLGDYDASEAIG